MSDPVGALIFRSAGVPPRCLACNYRLEGLTVPRCPECGREFDPRDPRTYSLQLRWTRGQWCIAWGFAYTVGLLLSMFLLPWEGPLAFIMAFFIAVVIRVGFFCNVLKVLGWVAAGLVLFFGALGLSFDPDPKALLVIALLMFAASASLLIVGHLFRRIVMTQINT